MRLILVRHAEAVAKGDNGSMTDAERPLTDRGRDQAERLGEAFQAAGVTADVVVTSPLIRARQTAEPLVPRTPGETRDPVVCSYLAPEEYRPKKLSRFVQELGAETVVLVGHNPDLSRYAAWLLGLDEAGIDLDKGAAVLVEFDGEIEKGGGRLGWLVTPSWFVGADLPVV